VKELRHCFRRVEASAEERRLMSACPKIFHAHQNECCPRVACQQQHSVERHERPRQRERRGEECVCACAVRVCGV